MKKLTVLLTLSLLLAFVVKPAYAESTDQSCTTDGDSNYESIIGNTLEQSFTPTLDRLTKIKLFIKGDGSGSLNVSLYHGGVYVATSNSTNEPTGFGTVAVTFDDTSVTPNDDSYTFRPMGDPDNTYLQWNYKSDCYTGGHAFKNGTPLSYDFGFTTYGYNSEGDGDEATPTPTEEVTPTDTPADDSTPTPTTQDGGSPTLTDNQDQQENGAKEQLDQESTPEGQEETIRVNTPGFGLSTLTQPGGLSLPLIIALTLILFVLLVLVGLGFYKFIYLKKIKKAKPTKDLKSEKPEVSTPEPIQHPTPGITSKTESLSQLKQKPKEKKSPKN